jgi:GNAT superfamily N-acetyltransferase
MRIALVAPDQHASLVDLLLEAHVHHRALPVADRASVDAHLHDAVLAPGSPVRLLVAADGPRVAGLAALVLLPSVIEPTGTDRWQCQLKELYVGRSHRGRGVGERLVRASARFALDHGCGRMDWNVQAGNDDGVRFYERLGGVRVGDRLSYRLGAAALGDLAQN